MQVALLDPAELQARFPWMRTDDLAGGSLGLADEGWFDAYALLQAFRRKARSLGVEYVAGEVEAIERDGSAHRWRAAGRWPADRRRDGGQRRRPARGGASPPWSALELPVRPRKRFVYHFDCRERLGPAPLTIAPSGVYFRPEGESWIGGYSPREGEDDPDTLDLEVDRSRFEDFVWPELARRVPAFESVRLLDAWAGHYEVNTLDHNAVIGPHPDLPGFLFANGFSGHGLQQAPGGRARPGRVDRHRPVRDAGPQPARLRAQC